MKLILIGASGAGKGSLAEFITRDFKIPHISTGQLFRSNIANKTPLGLVAGQYVKEGFFVPDDITVKMLLERLGKSDCKDGFILDGYPRTLNQAKLLSKYVEADYVVEIDASDETVIARLGGRYMCDRCDTIHNTRNDDLKKCKSCGYDKFSQRDDDTEEKILKRLEQYREQIGDLLEFYKQHGRLFTVQSDAADKPEDLYRKFLKGMPK